MFSSLVHLVQYNFEREGIRKNGVILQRQADFEPRELSSPHKKELVTVGC